MTNSTSYSREHEHDLLSQSLLAVASITIFMTFGMLLHEGGHWVAAKYYGYKTHFSYSRVSTIGATDITDAKHCVVKAGGPLVDFAFVIIGLSFLYKTRASGRQRTIRPAFWVATAFVLAALRWLKAPLQKGADESLISQLLGMSWYVVPWILLPPACLALGYMVWTHYRERTLLPLAIGFACGMAGFILWMQFIGPQLLPKLA